MTFPNQLKAANDAPVPANPFPAPSRPASALQPMFVGPNGLRAGWRILIFLTLFAGLFGGIVLVVNGGPQGVLDQVKRSRQLTVTPALVGENELVALIVLCAATLVMGKLERRKFVDYGLPVRRALGKDFWIGGSMGFLAISGTLLAMFLLRGFRVTGLAVHGTTILASLAGWGVAYLLSAMFEEFAFRGYVQYTLASGFGFWPAAFVMSGLFAGSREQNLLAFRSRQNFFLDIPFYRTH